MTQENKNDCFIIMPIGDCDGYPSDHFHHVYHNIIKPSVESANFIPIRADEIKSTNLIHLEILKKLIEAPMVICDLSTRNPNVLFELGIRQAFDKPVVLIQEKGTPKIFDISPLRYLEYSKDMKYHEVLETQKELKKYIELTQSTTIDSENVNSIVRLMAIGSPATLPTLKRSDKNALTLEIIYSQMVELKKMVEEIITQKTKPSKNTTISPTNFSNKSLIKILNEFNSSISKNNLNKEHNKISYDEKEYLEKKMNDSEITKEIMQTLNNLERSVYQKTNK